MPDQAGWPFGGDRGSRLGRVGIFVAVILATVGRLVLVPEVLVVDLLVCAGQERHSPCWDSTDP